MKQNKMIIFVGGNSVAKGSAWCLWKLESSKPYVDQWHIPIEERWRLGALIDY